MPTETFYAVDRIAGEDVTLISDDGRAVSRTRDQLPDGLEEGSVVRVSVDDRGIPDWSTARLDPEETKRRRRAARGILDELRERDPGGDVEL